MQINLNHLRIFYYAAKEKNLTKAAEALFVTQPAVTMQIKALEQYLETALFRKRGKFLELTDQGSMLFNYAEKIFRVVDEMEHALKGFASLTEGSLIIGTTRSFSRHLMPSLLSRYQEKFPGIKVSLEVGSSCEIAEGVAKFKYDLGIVGRIALPNKVKAVPYPPEEFCVVVSPDHRFAKRGIISCRELQNEPIIIREPGSGSRHFMLSFLASHGVTPTGWAGYRASRPRQLILTARAARVEAVDAIYLNIPDHDGLRDESLQGARLGFVGKQVIHPGQIPIVHAAFTPSAERVQRAERILEVWQKAEAEGKGVVALDGMLLEPPVIAMEQLVLERARQAR